MKENINIGVESNKMETNNAKNKLNKALALWKGIQIDQL